MFKNPFVITLLIGGGIFLIGLVRSVQGVIAVGAGTMAIGLALYLFYNHLSRARSRG